MTISREVFALKYTSFDIERQRDRRGVDYSQRNNKYDNPQPLT